MKTTKNEKARLEPQTKIKHTEIQKKLESRSHRDTYRADTANLN